MLMSNYLPESKLWRGSYVARVTERTGYALFEAHPPTPDAKVRRAGAAAPGWDATQGSKGRRAESLGCP